jgi:propanol-preferring alcohol dehydrogenase
VRAAVLERPGELLIRSAPDPVAGVGEIAVEVSVCGVCRTDLQIFDGDLEARKLPIIPGHQVIGRRVDNGQRVGVAWLGGACGHCDYCRQGLENLCPQAEFTGWTRDGGYASRIVARSDFIFPVPGEFSDTEAAPLMCAGIIGYRSLRLSGIQPGGRLGLFGFGSSAHLAIQVANHMGCKTYAFSRSEDERRLALELGAEWVGGYDDPPPHQLDAAVTFAPAGSVVVAALTAVRPGATVAINAIHLDRIPEFSYDLLWRERVLRSVANFTRRDATEFLDLAARVPVRAEVQIFPLEQAPATLLRLSQGQIHGSAVLDVQGVQGAPHQ